MKTNRKFLKAEELNKLFKRYNCKGITDKEKLEIREKIIISNVGFVYKIVSGYNSFGEEVREDLVSEGFIGLMQAIETFDYKRNIKFTTYSYFNIKQRILNFLRNNLDNIRKPSRVNVDEKIENKTISLDYLFEEINFQVEDKNNEIHKTEAKIIIDEALRKALKEDEIKLIEDRYGLNGKGQKTLQEIATELGVSRERVRQKESIAIIKMQRYFAGGLDE